MNAELIVRRWLLTIVTLLVGLVLLGGITRMRLAGLSIVEWNPITGIVPPLSPSDWRSEFVKYQTTPQYREMFAHLTLDDFKSIFYLEYFHRLLARLISILALAGLCFRRTRRIGLQGGLLLLFQGAIGWWMVKSGLIERVSVAPARLATHLILAAVTIGYFYRQALASKTIRKHGTPTCSRQRLVTSHFADWILAAIILFQFFLGALSSGTRAAEYFPTFPLMLGEWVPNGAWPASLSALLSDLPLSSHWLHRVTGTVLLSIAFWGTWKGRRGYRLLAVCLAIQYTLGVYTVLSAGAFALKILHQLGAVGVLLVTVRILNRRGAGDLSPTPPTG